MSTLECYQLVVVGRFKQTNKRNKLLAFNGICQYMWYIWLVLGNVQRAHPRNCSRHSVKLIGDSSLLALQVHKCPYLGWEKDNRFTFHILFWSNFLFLSYHLIEIYILYSSRSIFQFVFPRGVGLPINDPQRVLSSGKIRRPQENNLYSMPPLIPFL